MSDADIPTPAGENAEHALNESPGLDQQIQELKLSESARAGQSERHDEKGIGTEKEAPNQEHGETKVAITPADTASHTAAPEAIVGQDNLEATKHAGATDQADASNVYDNLEALGGFSPLQPHPAEQEYHDPTPRTPRPLSPARSTQGQQSRSNVQHSEELVDTTDEGISSQDREGSHAGDGVMDDDSRSEIQSIMEQFEGHGDGEDSPDSVDDPSSPSTSHPPRHSSLASPVDAVHSSPTTNLPQLRQEIHSPTKSPSIRSVSFSQQRHLSSTEDSKHYSPLGSPSSNKALPPIPDPEPELPFDFHRFLDQLKHRSADPVAKFLRSFLTEFGKKQWMVHEQVKIIGDFLSFITNKMAACDVWREVSDFEFDNAREGMEKLVMNRLYSQTFSPAIPPPVPTSPKKGKTKTTPRHPGPGRRGQHQEDVERDEILAQKVRIYGWVRERHLDIKAVGKSGQRFLTLAQQELLKIKSYRAPRDKIICVLNCCKVIFGLLKNSKEADTSADSFVPLLIYVILQANPDHLVSNVQYIFRFRNQEKLGGEAGYYLSSLMGAIQFIESLDRTSLTVGDEEFEKSVEAAVSAIAEKQAPSSPVTASASKEQHLSEKTDPEKGDRTPRASTDQQSGISSGQVFEAPVAGLLKTIQKPLNSIGRMFIEELGPEQPSGSASGSPRQRATPTSDQVQRLSPAVFQTPRRSTDGAAGDEGSGATPRESGRGGAEKPAARSPQMRAEDAAARQASAEAAEAQRIQRAEHRGIVETLAGMFPNLDRDVIDDVVRMKEGRVGSAVDACLALNA